MTSLETRCRGVFSSASTHARAHVPDNAVHHRHPAAIFTALYQAAGIARSSSHTI